MYERDYIAESLAIGGILVIFAVAFSLLVYGDEPDDWWLIPKIVDGYEPRWVPVYYVDHDFYCETHAKLARGCYVLKPLTEYIMINKNVEFDWANQGCTVHDHEWFHAMGWGHGMGPLDQTCPPFGGMVTAPRVANGIATADPLYEHIPTIPDPRMIKWK